MRSLLPGEGISIPTFSPEFEAIFAAHYDLVYRTAYGVTRKVEDAEDVTQTIFLRVFRSEIPIASMKNPAGYMYRAAVNLSLALIRSRRAQSSGVDLEEVAQSLAGTISHDEEDHRKLYRAIAKLPPKSAEMIILRYQRAMSDVQIAHLLGTSRGVVAVTLYRARRRLRKILVSLEGEE